MAISAQNDGSLLIVSCVVTMLGMTYFSPVSARYNARGFGSNILQATAATTSPDHASPAEGGIPRNGRRLATATAGPMSTLPEVTANVTRKLQAGGSIGIDPLSFASSTLTTMVTALFEKQGQNVRSLKHPGGCLDGGFSGYSCGNMIFNPCPFTIGYWESCNSEPWQQFTLSEGKLWYSTGVNCWGAHRCLDGYGMMDGTPSSSQVCGFKCWGGKNQELVAEATNATATSRGEMVFQIKSRAFRSDGTDMCLTWKGNNSPTAFEVCHIIPARKEFGEGDWLFGALAGNMPTYNSEQHDDQLWFIPDGFPNPK